MTNNLIDHELNLAVLEKSPTQASSTSLVKRAKRLLSTEIEFISNESFFECDADGKILAQLNLKQNPKRETTHKPTAEEPVPSDLAKLCRFDLLSKEEEPLLFQKMNYLKFKANRLRSKIDPQSPDHQQLDQIEELLDSAKEIRDRIIQANTRLVMAVVKRHLSKLFTYEEMFSDGILTLMSAVDKFDYDRGFRFSTYAYHSISRGFYRSIKKRNNEKKRFSFRNDFSLTDVQESDQEIDLDAQSYEEEQALLEKVMSQLEQRERVIIRDRFGLGAEEKSLTLRAIGAKLRLSKERVRQLEQKALEKMKDFTQGLVGVELLDC